jgi:chemotaxis methyl-accepting protein methylase
MTKALAEIIDGMRRRYGRDISRYDEAFLLKSLNQRLTATGTKSADAYGRLLAADQREREAFWGALNIAHSEFFRNSLTFALLGEYILPSLTATKKKQGQAEIRIWSAGCAAGQEAYSIAILMDELSNGQESAVAYRIFATDHSEAELATARKGVYSDVAVQNVKLKHVRKYFTANKDAYQIIPALKNRVDFSTYDLLDEHSVCPPVSLYGDFDLICCGNLLFYYRPEIQQRILDKVCRALSPNGYLVTGEAEREILAQHKNLRAVAPPVAVFQKTGTP